MHITKSTLADMRYVLANLSKEFRRELELGGFSLDQLRTSMKAFIKSEECLTLWVNENIIGMLGFQVQHSAIVTAFPSTPNFFKQDTARFGRKLMRKIQADMGNLPVVSESYSENERVEDGIGQWAIGLTVPKAIRKFFDWTRHIQHAPHRSEEVRNSTNFY